MDLVRSNNAAAQVAAQGAGGAGGQEAQEETVYVETAEDLANVTVASVGGQPGLHLTTITVAVPAPLSPNELLQQQHVVAAGGTSVALPTVPAPPETAVRWKYEQSKPDKQLSSATGSSLVSFLFYLGRLEVSDDPQFGNKDYIEYHGHFLFWLSKIKNVKNYHNFK